MAKDIDTQTEYRKYVISRLEELNPIFAYASIGDFSHDVQVPDTNDEFTELFTGIQIILEVIRSQTAEMKTLNEVLSEKISDLRNINAELELERARIEAMLSSIGEGVIVADAEFNTVFVNDATADLLQCAKQELTGKTWQTDLAVLESEDGTPVPLDQTPMRRAFAERKKITSTQFWYRRKDKSRFPVSKIASPIMLADRLIGVVAVFRDISKEIALDRAKSEFVSLASHQLRTPLSAIGWYAEVVLKEKLGPLNDEQKRYLMQIAKSNHRMIDLVNSLLNVSRIEMGTLTIQPKAVDIGVLIQGIITELHSLTQQKQIIVSVMIPEVLPSIEVDPQLIRIAIENIIVNALKYTPNGGGVTIAVSEEQSGIRIMITDTGYGIPRNQQPNIFTKLFRADNIRSKEPEGNGLGLYLSRAIVERSGGTLSFSSEEGKGTTFAMVLPHKSPIEKKGSTVLTPLHIHQANNSH